MASGQSSTSKVQVKKKTGRQKRPSRIWESDSSSPSPPRSESASSQCSSAQFRYLSGDTLHALHTLASEKSIVLFTPVVPHPSDSDRQGKNEDPFEPLGCAISKYHARVRHVPYLPEVGLTQTHVIFLQHAGAIIVVWCEPTLTLKSKEQLSLPGPQNLATKTFNGQSHFLKAVRKAMYPSKNRTLDKSRVPLIVITTGPVGCLLDQDNGMHDFDTVIFCPYQTRPLKGLPDILFNREWTENQATSGTPSGEVSKLSLVSEQPSLENGQSS